MPCLKNFPSLVTGFLTFTLVHIQATPNTTATVMLLKHKTDIGNAFLSHSKLKQRCYNILKDPAMQTL
jgi:hypothetical protein